MGFLFFLDKAILDVVTMEITNKALCLESQQSYKVLIFQASEKNTVLQKPIWHSGKFIIVITNFYNITRLVY